MSDITVYGGPGCADCRRSKRFLDERGIDYAWIDLADDPAAEATVMRLNRGMRVIPTIVFADGSVLSEPSDAELAAKLGLA
jgi:glutaredoxin